MHHSEFSLIQKQAAQKALVVKMRTRLAAGSEFDAKLKENQKVLAQKNRFRWFTAAGIAACIILGNLAYLGYKHETKSIAKTKHAERLAPPSTNLSLEEQGLYWTYALYDYNMLKTRFGVPKGVVIDARLAAIKLKELLPKLDLKTQYIIHSYLPQPRQNS